MASASRERFSLFNFAMKVSRTLKCQNDAFSWAAGNLPPGAAVAWVFHVFCTIVSSVVQSKMANVIRLEFRPKNTQFTPAMLHYFLSKMPDRDSIT